MGGDITVTLSYEEKIMNALAHVEHGKDDDVITRDKREFDAIRRVLAPLYDELRLNAAMLARQTDLARNAENERDEARRRSDLMEKALVALVNAAEDAMESPAEAESWAQTGDMNGYLEDARAALGGRRHPHDECPCRASGHDMLIHTSGEPPGRCRRCGIGVGDHVRLVHGGGPSEWEIAPCPYCLDDAPRKT